MIKNRKTKKRPNGLELSGAANPASDILVYLRLIIKLNFRPTPGVRFSDWLGSEHDHNINPACSN
jgi:hypothetical protein